MVGSPELSPTKEKRGKKKRGEFSTRFFFPRQFFSRALLPERERLIRTWFHLGYNHCKPIGIYPAGAKSDMVMHDVKKDKGGRTKHNFVHNWKSFLNFIYVRTLSYKKKYAEVENFLISRSTSWKFWANSCQILGVAHLYPSLVYID